MKMMKYAAVALKNVRRQRKSAKKRQKRNAKHQGGIFAKIKAVAKAVTVKPAVVPEVPAPKSCLKQVFKWLTGAETPQGFYHDLTYNERAARAAATSSQ